MNLLSGARFYLAGPVESAGISYWRRDLTPLLVEHFGAVVWDPLVKPGWMPDVDGAAQAALKFDVTSERTRSINGVLRKFCQHMVANCDIVIVMVDKTFTVGTFEELGIAKYKPIFVLTDGKDIPSMWLVDQLDAYNNLEFVFHDGIDSLLVTLCKISLGEIKLDDPFKWMFLTYNLGASHVSDNFKIGDKSS